jgi:hypothetical protein
VTEKLLLSVKDAAEALGISERLLRYELAAGRVPRVVFGRRAVRIPVAWLREEVEKRTAEAAQTSAVQKGPSLARPARLSTG